MKTEFVVEYDDNKKVFFSELEDIAKKQWKDDGNHLKDIKTLNLYFKPYENACFMVINGEDRGSFQI